MEYATMSSSIASTSASAVKSSKKGKKIETKTNINISSQKDIENIELSNIYNMETPAVENTITIKPKRQYNKKAKPSVVEPVVEEVEIECCKGCGECDGEEQYGWYCETCYAEKLGHYPQATDKNDDDDEEEVVDEIPETPIQTIKIKITHTKEQLAELEKQRKEIEAKEVYNNWYKDEEKVVADVYAYYKAEAEKSYEILVKAGVEKNVAQYQLTYIDILHLEYNELDPELIEKVWNLNHKKTSKSTSTTGKTKPQNPIGEGKRRGEREEKLNSGKMNDKIMGLTDVWKGYKWGLLERGKDGKDPIIIAKQGETYSLPVWSEVLEIIGKDGEYKKKEDMVSWISKNMKK
jgi:hypothetical protein